MVRALLRAVWSPLLCVAELNESVTATPSTTPSSLVVQRPKTSRVARFESGPSWRRMAPSAVTVVRIRPRERGDPHARLADLPTHPLHRTPYLHAPLMAWTNGYTRTSTKEHKAWARAILSRDGYTCRIRGPRCIGRATIADHIKNVAEHPELEHDIANGQAACAPCHDPKTQQEAQRGQQRYRARGRYQPARDQHPGLR